MFASGLRLVPLEVPEIEVNMFNFTSLLLRLAAI